MIAKPQYRYNRDDIDRGNREHGRREKALDEALQNTFPASDPVSAEQPVMLAAKGNVNERPEISGVSAKSSGSKADIS